MNFLNLYTPNWAVAIYLLNFSIADSLIKEGSMWGWLIIALMAIMIFVTTIEIKHGP